MNEAKSGHLLTEVFQDSSLQQSTEGSFKHYSFNKYLLIVNSYSCFANT